MKEYKVICIKIPVAEWKEFVLEKVLNYFECKKENGFKVEQILVYTDVEIELLCSENGSYHFDEDTDFDHVI